ncbi:MAG: hypothetical protein HWN71_07745, partial [Desulfobacterales bacterium]|nr:hypothetical protein [Desulfobacterales bacterium]
MRWELREKYERLKTGKHRLIEKECDVRILECSEIKDKEERLTCKFKALHEISRVQDRVNIDIMRDLKDV